MAERQMRAVISAGAVGLAAWAGPADAQRVDRLWADSCVRCHGEDGSGANATSLLDEEWVVGPSARDMFRATKEGVEAYGMPGYGEALSDEEIWGLVVHMQELRARAKERREGAPRADDDGAWRTQHHAFTVEDVIAGGIQTPWSVDFLPDGAMLVTERQGRLRVYREGELGEPIEGAPAVRAVGQGGLLDVAPHPEYAQNGWIYLAFSDEIRRAGRSVGMTKVVRGRLEGGRWVDEETIFRADPERYLPTNLHFGCRIVFVPRDGDAGGYDVYFGIGERGMAAHAQDLSRPNGKIHRLRDDGSVPDDNPFLGREGALPSIYSYGTRNPQGMVVDGEGRVWITEHGPRGGDELNLVAPGVNFGWPEVSYGINYNGTPLTVPWPEQEGEIEMPVYVWTPSIAACGLDIARGGAFEAWEGDLLSGGLVAETVRRVRVERREDEGGEPRFEVVEEEEVLHGLGRVRDVVTGPDGLIYVVLNSPDKVVRLAPVDDEQSQPR